MTYNYPKDGKLHTRFHELLRCTDGQIDNVIAERFGDLAPFENDITYFGTKRHEMLEKYIKENNELPKQFKKLCEEKGIELEVNGKQVEKEICCEMFNGVVIHGTPDLFGSDWIVDFKTTTRPESFSANKQTLFYAWLFQPYGLKITKSYYLMEIWNLERDKILGYDVIEKEITQEAIDKINDWALERARTLYKAVKTYERTHNVRV